MFDDVVIITVNGQDWYVPANLVQYITADGVNTSSSTITGYQSLAYSTSSRYPRITFNSLSYPVIYSSAQNYQILQSATVDFSSAAYYQKALVYAPVLELFLTGLIFIFVAFRRFTR